MKKSCEPAKSRFAALFAMIMTGAEITLTAACVLTAGVTFLMTTVVITMVLAMVAALYVGIVFQAVFKKGSYRSISLTADAAEQTNSGFGQSNLCSPAYTAADEYIYTEIFKKTCKCAMTASGCIFYTGGLDNPVIYMIDLKVFAMTKMLINLTIFISDCNFHFFLLLF